MEYPTDDGLNIYIATQKIADDGIKVCITGLGGDEFFGGYSSFNMNIIKSILYRSYLWKPFKLARKYVLNKGYGGLLNSNYINCSEIAGYANNKAFVFDKMPSLLVNESIQILRSLLKDFLHKFDIKDYYKRISILELYGYCVPQLVKDSDVFGMANSVEVRPSLLLKTFLINLFSGQENQKHQFKKKDFLLKNMNKDIKDIINPNKTGFTIDIDSYIRANQAKIISEIKASGIERYIEYPLAVFRKKIKKPHKLENRLKYIIWRAFILSMWKLEN